MTHWITVKGFDGNVYPPSRNTHCIILVQDRDGVSLVPLNSIYEGNNSFVLINDGMGEIIKSENVVAYFTYDYTNIMETL